MTRGKWVALVVGLCVVTLGLAMAFRGLRSRGVVPSALRVEAVQDRYGAQLDRLRALVLSFDRTGYGGEAIAQDRELFSAPEILDAKVQQRNEQSFLGVSPNEFRFARGREHVHATPRVGKPSVSVWAMTDFDGGTYSVVKYEELVSMGDGTHRLISITLDIAKALGASDPSSD